MVKYKVGMRVIALGSGTFISPYATNLPGTVIIAQDDMIGVEFDSFMRGHSCGGRGKPGHCWNFATDSRRIRPLHVNHIANKGAIV